jgi:acyl-ACP thioesterase
MVKELARRFMKNYFDQKFNLRFFEMNNFGFSSPTTLLTLLEETAAEHCNNIGYSLYELERQNIGWVLISGAIEMTRYPKYKEDIIIRTWLSKYSPVKGYRENIIFDGSGRIIGKAKGMWAFYDIVRKRPVPIFREIKERWGIEPDISTEINTDVLSPIQNGISVKNFDVYRSDIDSNRHVNNIRYFHWLIESLPDETVENYYLKRIDAKFFSDAKFGEKIQVYLEESQGKNIFTHTMRSNLDGRVFTSAYTEWEKIR